MVPFFSRERFGRPQVLAGLFLLLFLAQCVWLVRRGISKDDWDPGEEIRLMEGVRQWGGGAIAGTSNHTRATSYADVALGLKDGYDPNHSPLWYLVASAPLVILPREFQLMHELVAWLVRVPYLLFGLLLGASLWYVSRRLYGNAGGYIALALYCFSPGFIRSSAAWAVLPETGAAWGAFGAVFTAIAVAHTLYAPREVVLWNWRRILLLGLSLALAIGSQFSLIIVVPVALAFMLYLAPERRVAAVVIWAAACGIGFLLLYASYFFHARMFWEGIRHADFLRVNWRAFAEPRGYQQMLVQFGQLSPALIIAAPLALVVYLAWPRARYFGNTAPLLVAALLLILGLGTPNYPGLGFPLVAVPFLFAFVGGVASDRLETRSRSLVLACVWGLCIANALWCLWELARTGRG
jgi:hypothetical protein